MTQPEVDEFIAKAEAIYDEQIRTKLEPEHKDWFVAIEPKSGDHFLGKTLSEAAQAARRVYPDRPTHAIRIGHSAALHFGMQIR